MKPRVSVLIIGVNDLEKSLKFYRGLGFATDGIAGTEFEHGAVVFFDLQNNLKLALYQRGNAGYFQDPDVIYGKWLGIEHGKSRISL